MPKFGVSCYLDVFGTQKGWLQFSMWLIVLLYALICSCKELEYTEL